MFGARRKVLSGSSGRDDETRSDSTHPTLFIESKLRASTATRSLWDQTRVLARREGKTPVLMLFDKRKPGALVVVHQKDLAAVAAELARAVPASDSTHPTLFIEVKLKAATATRSLWEQTRVLARREGKVPVLLLFDKRKPGALVVVHQKDLAAVAAELARAVPASESTSDPSSAADSPDGGVQSPRSDGTSG
jgi:hypothetical protein